MNSDVLVQATDLSRHYGPHCAVDKLSLSLKRGQVLGLLGPNGAGKTSTLRMLTGCLAPSAGHVTIGGFDMRTHASQAKALLGYLPETPPLHKELNVQEYLNFCARLHQVPRAQRKPALERALHACDLEQVSHQLIGSLSKGYQQRVGLAQAIVHSPPLIVLDEPTVGLDPNQMQQIRLLITDLAKEHAIILSTHILSEVQAVCDRVAIMTRGKIVFNDSLSVLTDNTDTAPTLRLHLGLSRPPTPSALAQLSGAVSVEALAEGRFKLSMDASSDPREQLAQLAATQDWGLFELTLDKPGPSRSLEQVFMELTA